MFDPIIKFLREADIEFKENYDLSILSSIKIGGVARLVTYPASECELIALIRCLRRDNIPYKIIGGATNILFNDGEIKTVIVSTKRIRRVKITDAVIYAECGASQRGVCRVSLESGLGGLEALSGIPGSIGGAIMGNSGAFGAEISDSVRFVRAYDPQKDVVLDIPISECGFSYRHSRFKNSGEVILGASLMLYPKDRAEITEKTRRYQSLRMEKQPCDMPSLGCTFKKIQSTSAGELIDRCGLKGQTLGRASVSDKHAGFIVNNGGADAADYIGLMYLCRKSVFEKFHLNLEPEIVFLKH